MRKVSYLLLIVLFVVILSCEQKTDIDSEKLAIKSVLDNYVTAVENEDMELYSTNIAHDSEMVNYGGSGGPIIGWDALKEVMENQNATLSEIKIDVRDMVINISKTGKFAWVTCLWSFNALVGENPINLPARCTWILEKRKDSWVIVHFHKSMSAG